MMLAGRPFEERYHGLLSAAVSNLPMGLRRPRIRSWDILICILSHDVQPFNVDIHPAWHHAVDH